MRQADRFEFIPNRGEIRQAMLAGTKHLLRGTRKIPSMILTNVICLLCAIGGLAVVVLLGQMLEFNARPWLIFGFLLSGGLYLLSFQMLYFELARQVEKQGIRQGPQVVTLDQMGVTNQEGEACWTIPWAMIDGVVKTRATVSLVVGGMAIAIPKRVIGDKAEVTQLFTDIKSQIANA